MFTDAADEPLLALDIGTRKVAGVLADLSADGKLSVHAAAVAEHPTRCMLDGQVHDVRQVAATVRRVLDALRGQARDEPVRAAVAAAGRALACHPAEAVVTREARRPVAEGERQAAALAALAAARDKARAAGSLHCVGYAVTGYRLDGEPVGNPVGQRGGRLEAAVLATFLPARVLDGLTSVLSELSLTAHSVNLEPIAALSLALPPDARRLPLALVDVGAGTSDIAVCRGGAVAAFAMVPLAGDELSERLCEAFFLDFQEAERVKRAAAAGETVEALNLVGRLRSLAPETVREALAPAVAELSDRIGSEILRLNGGPPTGVVLVGGSSALPDLADAIAERLGLPTDRVGARAAHLLPWVTDRTGRMGDAAAVTTLGIAWCALRGEVLRGAAVRLNGEPLTLLQAGPALRVSDALVGGDFPSSRVWGRPGLALTATVDGRLTMVPGEAGTPLVVRRNGQDAAPDTEIVDGDEIVALAARDGRDAASSVGAFLGERMAYLVQVNEERVRVRRAVRMNGRPVAADEPLPDRAELTLGPDPVVRQALDAYLALPAAAAVGLGGSLREREVLVTVDGVPRVLRQRTFSLRANGRECEIEAPLAPGDTISLELAERHLRVRDVAGPAPDGPARVRMNGREVGWDEFVVDGAAIEVDAGPGPVSAERPGPPSERAAG